MSLSFKLFDTVASPVSVGDKHHKLSHDWIFYSHLPHDTSWTLDTYKRIFDISYLEDAIGLLEHTPHIVVEKCMLFIMKSHIKPIWEDPHNKNGGCFSFKVPTENVANIWKIMAYLMMGDTLCNPSFSSHISGLSISPKKGFCIIKVWMDDMTYNDPAIFNVHIENELKTLENNAIFKSNRPEY